MNVQKRNTSRYYLCECLSITLGDACQYAGDPPHGLLAPAVWAQGGRKDEREGTRLAFQM
jgi:hypothetical protein